MPFATGSTAHGFTNFLGLNLMRYFPGNPSRLCLNVLAWIALVSVFTQLSAMVVPHPLYKNPVGWRASRPSQEFGPRSAANAPSSGVLTNAKAIQKTLPTHVLVLRVQFSDVTFADTPAYPDSLVHDKAFFERWMLHLTDFYADASHNQYIINYSMPDEVITLPHPMAYYGQDTSEKSDVLVEQMVADAIQVADATINYNDYDALIVFHAGAGQESDVGVSPNYTPLSTSSLWSTFLSRDDFQAAFDPENDNYPGITTQDNKIITEVVLMPESEFHTYFPVPPNENSGVYFFSLYGVLCHQFGHQLGLPTLFDNVSSNGRSQGIGNWGLMGTGVWNSNGYVPAQLDAWCRYYLGWETVQTLAYDAENMGVDYFRGYESGYQRVYKIPISDKEYFLVENRQQNPDASIDPISGFPSFTFTLLDPGEQDYYPAPDTLRPFFNFMKNRYKNCEWDFFLPGLGGPLRPGEAAPTDGSGLLIWHIDENIIAENFSPDFDMNHVNFDAAHKGVDVEEADGIQNLDTAVFDYYKYGGPFDTFRADESNPEANNPYFGNETLNGLLHLPTAASYYGGIPLEIFNIGPSGNQMSFSLRRGWKLDTGYVGINTMDACSIDFDDDGEKEIFYPMPTGELYMWKDETMMHNLPNLGGVLAADYVWDGETLYFPVDITSNPTVPVIKLSKWKYGSYGSVFTDTYKKWAAQPISAGANLLLPIISTEGLPSSSIRIMNKLDPLDVDSFNVPDSICSNLAYYKNSIYTLIKSDLMGYRLFVLKPDSTVSYTYNLPIPADSSIVSITAAAISGTAGNLLIQTPYSAYLTDLTGELVSGFPKLLPMYCASPASLSDVDKNGSLDMLFGGENTFAVLDYNGSNVLTNFNGLSQTDTLYVTSGVLAGNLDADSRTEYLGAFSRNRLAGWEDNQRLLPGLPVSFSERSRNLPFIHTASDTVTYVWVPADNGKIYRSPLPQNADVGFDPHWYCKYGNLQRTAAREDTLANEYFTSSFFVPRETYIFPNPLKSIYDPKLTFNVMTSQDASVEVSVYNIRGTKLFEQKVICKAWLRNREAIDFPVDHLSSGVYLAVLKSGNHIKRFKFAVEK